MNMGIYCYTRIGIGRIGVRICVGEHDIGSLPSDTGKGDELRHGVWEGPTMIIQYSLRRSLYGRNTYTDLSRAYCIITVGPSHTPWRSSSPFPVSLGRLPISCSPTHILTPMRPIPIRV